MGDKITLKIDKRSIHGKKVRQLRQQGLVPGVVYGAGIDPIDVQADAGEVRKVVAAAGKHTPIHLVGSKRRIAMIKSVDYNPARRGDIRHVGFHAVNANDPVEADVPIRLTGMGESPAERAGFVVLQSMESIPVKALPMDLPDSLDVSVEGLEKPGDRLTVGDITVPKNVEIIDNDDGREGTDDDDVTVMNLVVASVYEPSALEAANEAVGGDAESADAEEVESANGGEEPAGEAEKTAE